MSSSDGDNEFDWFCDRLDKFVASYRSPEERRVGYGNLRHEYSTTRVDGAEVTNIALIYETPGGSTAQFNITYDHATEKYEFLDDDLEDHIVTESPARVMEAISDHVSEIPEKRQTALDRQVDEWIGSGSSSREVFSRLNRLLQDEFLGGRVTTTELKSAIKYAMKLQQAESG